MNEKHDLKPVTEDEAREEVAKLASRATAEWLAKNGTYEQVKQIIHQRLDKSFEDVIINVMGFSSEWRYGGRELLAGSTAQESIKKHGEKAVDEWISKALDKLPPPKDSVRKACIKAYNETIMERAKVEVERIAVEQAQKLIKEVVKK